MAVSAHDATLHADAVHHVQGLNWHLGHLDLMCELVDGRVGEEPPVL